MVLKERIIFHAKTNNMQQLIDCIRPEWAKFVVFETIGTNEFRICFFETEPFVCPFSRPYANYISDKGKVSRSAIMKLDSLYSIEKQLV